MPPGPLPSVTAPVAPASVVPTSTVPAAPSPAPSATPVPSPVPTSTGVPLEDDPPPQPSQPYSLDFFWEIVTKTCFALLVLDVIIGVLVGLLTSDLQTGITTGGLMLLFQIIYAVLSIRKIGENENGARLFFGRPINNLVSGPAFVPLLVMKLIKAPKIIVQLEIPTDPEFIYRASTDGSHIPQELVDAGYRPPIRTTFAKDPNSNEPLRQELTAEVVPVVQLFVHDLCIFLGTIGSFEKLRRQIEDTCVAFANQQLARKVLADVRKDLGNENVALRTEIRRAIGNWGVTLKTALIKEIRLSHALNTSIQSASDEAAKALGAIIKAKTLKATTELEGRGKGAAERAVLRGRTTGLKDMAKRLKVPMPTVLGAEVARDVAKNPGQTVILGGEDGFADFAKIAAGVGGALKGMGKPKSTPPASSITPPTTPPSTT